MSGFIVVWTDWDGGIVGPYTWDATNPDTLCAASDKDVVAMFDSRADARKAIAVSVAYAKYQLARGGVVNDDFLDKNLKKVKIWQVAKKEPQKL